MTIETQLLNFKTSDKETLHGLLLRRASGTPISALLLVTACDELYFPPLATFGQPG